MADKIIFTGVGGFVAGVFLRSFVDFGFALPAFLVLLGVSVMLWGGVTIKTADRGLYFILPFFLLSAAFGVARFELSLGNPDLELSTRIGDKVAVFAFVTDEPDAREDKVFLEVELFAIIDGSNRIEVSDKARVSVDFAPEVKYGDTLLLNGTLRIPENFETESGQIFDYKSYLEKDGIHFEMSRPVVEIVSRGGGSPIKRLLFGLKKEFLTKTARIIEEPENSLLAGLLLGDKHGLGKDLTEDFRRAGLVHIIVLSGFNMTIVALAIRWFLERIRLSKKQASFFGILGIIIFVVMVGGGATAVRAAIMAILAIVARLLGRDYLINRALFGAAFMMIMHNPQIVAFDPSFQLSFMATLGLIHLSPIIESKLHLIPEFFETRGIVAATISTQIFVLPLLISMSGEVSLVSVLTNVLILPFIPVTMLVGFIAGMLAFVSSLIAAPFAFASIVLLKFEIVTAHFFGSLPFSVFPVPPSLAVVVLVCYLCFIAWFFAWRASQGIVKTSQIRT